MHSSIVVKFNIIYALLVTILCTVFMYMYMFTFNNNNNKTYIYDLYALVFLYTLSTSLHSPSLSSVDEVHVPATKWRATKCPSDKMVADQMSP